MPPEERTATARTHERSTAFLQGLLADTVAGLRASICWSSTHALADLVFTVAANDARAAEFLTRCLLPAELKTATAPHLEIFVCTGSTAPYACPPSWNLPYTDPRQLEGLHLSSDGKVSAFYDHARGFLTILDMETRRALLWATDSESLPPWEAAAPFKQILQWSLAGGSMTLLHGGAVTCGGQGVLLVGAGGSGKSTTVAACLQAGLGVCGDDLIVVGRSGRGWVVHALYDSLKLLPNTNVAVPPLLTAARWHECGDKRFVRYTDVAPGSLARSASVRALVHCRVARSETSRLIPVTSAEMLRAIGPPTVFLLRGREGHILKEVGAMVRSLPCLRLELGKNPAEAAEFLRRWLEAPSGE